MYIYIYIYVFICINYSIRYANFREEKTIDPKRINPEFTLHKII